MLNCSICRTRQVLLEARALAILGEGNTSMRLGEKTFAVKASGSNLATLSANLTECRF